MTADATLYLRHIHEQVKARETTMAKAMAEGQRMIAADKARRARLLACCGGA